MALPTYLELQEKFLNHHPATPYFPKETAYSLPVCLKRTDGIYDAFFIYSYPKNKEEMNPLRPFAWAAFATNGGPASAFNWCSVQDFVDTQQFPLGQPVSAKLTHSVGTARQRTTFGEAVTAYEKLRLFAFHHNPTVAQLQLIAVYKKAFSEIVPEGLYPFYYALSPEFFDWIRLPLPHPGQEKPQRFMDREILEEVADLRLTIEDLQREQRKVRESDRLVETLHQELQEYRNDVLEDISSSLERDIISLIDSVAKSLDFYKEEPPTAQQYQKLLGLFQGVKEDLTDALYRQGVDPYTEDGTQVQLPRQRVIDTVPTPHQTLDKTLAARIAPGWAKEDKILRPEYVSAYLYQPTEKDSPPLAKDTPPKKAPHPSPTTAPRETGTTNEKSDSKKVANPTKDSSPPLGAAKPTDTQQDNGKGAASH